MVKILNRPVTFLGLVVCAIAVQFSTANAVGAQYVVAIVRIAHAKPPVLTSRLDQSPPNQFRIQRNTLARQITSEFVLQSALIRKDIAQLKTVRDHEPQSLIWLQKSLKVELPEDSELVILTLSSSGDTDELKEILQAVIEAFMQDVLAKERMEVEKQKQNVREFYSDASKEYQSKLEKYLLLKKEIGGDDNAELRLLKLNLEVQENFLKELYREMLVIRLNDLAADGFFRILQPPTAVAE